jgi:cephalosporin hydroxylase
MSTIVRQTDNFGDVTWLGRPVWQNIADIWNLQEGIVARNVDLVVECGTNRGGSSYFMGSLFDLLGRGHVITIDVERLFEALHPRVEFHQGSSVALEIVELVHRRAAELAPHEILVLLDSDHRAGHVLAELRAYADLVPEGGYMLVQDGLIDELRKFRRDQPGPLAAIRQFLDEDRRFVIDRARSERFFTNHSPSGWLRRL